MEIRLPYGDNFRQIVILETFTVLFSYRPHADDPDFQSYNTLP